MGALSLLKETGVYKTVLGDKMSDRISHAYLILSQDKDNLINYLKVVASLIVCKEGDPCEKCRNCSLINSGKHIDVVIVDRDGAILAEDVNRIIEECFIKPIESDKKVFVINGVEKMNQSAQNKILKVLEEPPKNVHFILGATSEFALLPTVKSRTKKLTVPPFSNKTLLEELSSECTDKQKLENAIRFGDGTVGKAKSLYFDEKFNDCIEFAKDMLVNMNSSRDVLEYSVKASKLKSDLIDLFDVLEFLLRDMLVVLEKSEQLVINTDALEQTKNAKGFNSGSIIHALDKITEARKRYKFNANPQMLTEWLMLQILEGKFKWQKL